ncbi:hypothetical protein ACG7TL_003457 [Trametes sanguinea]
MDYNSAAWLQTQQIPDLQSVSVHDERSAAGSNDWKDSAASVQNGGDMNDFLGDIQGRPNSDDDDAHSVFATVQHTPTPPIPQSSNTFSLSIPPLVLSTSTPYNAVSYGNQWMPTPQLPLSSYSSLNGATSTSSHSHPQSLGQGQAQGQSQVQGAGQMVIDPALTTMNGSSASPPPQYQQPQYLSAQAQARLQYQYQQPTHQSMSFINPSFTHANISQYQQQQAHQHSLQIVRQSHSSPQPQQQGTLSPYALHSPSPMGGHYTAIPPSSFYGQTSPPPQSSQSSQPIAGPSSASPPESSSTSQSAPTPPPAASSTEVSVERARAKLVADLRPLIQPNSFTGGGAVSQLVNILDDFGVANVDPKLRLDIVTKIRDCAGNHYFRAWVDNSLAMEVVREWLKLAHFGRKDPQLVETIMPLLHIIDRLPMSLEKLGQYKLGKLIMKLMKDPPTPAIKDMASNLEQKWRKMLNAQQAPASKAESDKTEDTKGKKRRAEPASSKNAPPAKKVAVPVAGSSKTKAVAVKETKPVVKDAKSDSSFFSKPKTTKTQMPSFKKNTSTPSASMSTAPSKKEPDANTAQPSHHNHFQDLLKDLQGPSAAGPSNSTPPPGPSAGPSTGPGTDAQPPPGQPGLGKRKKSVTWAPDGQLEQIKLIERAVYDDDGTTGSHPTHSLRDLDRGEGAALHNHLFEEQLGWDEPQPLEMPSEFEIPERGNQSQERVAQEEREQSALVVSYASPAQIPDSPAEPPTQIPEEQVDEGVRIMLCGPEVDAIFWNEGAPAPVMAMDTPIPSTSVAELVGQLAAPAFPPASQPISSLGINPEQLQQLAQVLSSQGNVFGVLGGPQGPPPHAPTGPSHGGASGDQGCRYGDQCDFSHEPLNYGS